MFQLRDLLRSGCRVRVLIDEACAAGTVCDSSLVSESVSECVSREASAAGKSGQEGCLDTTAKPLLPKMEGITAAVLPATAGHTPDLTPTAESTSTRKAVSAWITIPLRQAL